MTHHPGKTLTCDLGWKLFGQVSHYLEMNKMHLIEKTFIRNRFDVLNTDYLDYRAPYNYTNNQ